MFAGLIVVPDPADVPLPSFDNRAVVITTSLTDDAKEIQEARQVSLAESLERCAGILMSSCSAEVRALLQDIASVLLRQETRTLKMTRLAEQLAESSHAFLQSKRVGLKAVLLCYMADFRIGGHGRQRTVSYMHDTTWSEWHLAYEVTVGL
eukprot:TRINITY_DN76334_c0_g1_i1.p1 TRINITY_DN76334_c0_g1~~TRINITY_DN76334_c0_g1_i1.p1  ORF type:complete len:151 (+),score=11.91 TRINITY_DN76334_c0_g1_i1:102-554(+)